MNNVLVSAENLQPGDNWTEDCHPERESVFYVVYHVEPHETYEMHIRLIAYKNGNSYQTILKTLKDTRLVIDRPE